ncbi:unnamed protein product [Notodromas monacha]|uniref:non-specific serine/threonine protein kinase n=1 Tax=Notodromas monacha TaxID=399045 RepID=A0A7R9GDM2_9CRUS|nr:unnamed protein product [Notodromas monacha]CAG0918684.1 unnamed protein product [Notodromas monacha]
MLSLKKSRSASRNPRSSLSSNQRRKSLLSSSSLAVNKISEELLYDSFSYLFQQCDNPRARNDCRVNNFLRRNRECASSVLKIRLSPDDFDVKKIIGNGRYGEVQLVSHRRTDQLFAMKVVSKSFLRPDSTALYVDQEREIMAATQSDWHIKLHFAFHDSLSVYLVMDYHPGGDLLQLLVNNAEIFKEIESVRFYAAEIIMAINDLHKLGYIHRDLKPENILIDRSGHLKLGDFGSAARIDSATGAACSSDPQDCGDCPFGTPEYTAPELLDSSSKLTASKSSVNFRKLSETATPYVPTLTSDLDTSHFDECSNRPNSTSMHFSSFSDGTDTARGVMPMDLNELNFVGFSYSRSEEDGLDFTDSDLIWSENFTLQFFSDEAIIHAPKVHQSCQTLEWNASSCGESDWERKFKTLEEKYLTLLRKSERSQSSDSFLKEQIAAKEKQLSDAKKQLVVERETRVSSEGKMMQLMDDIKKKWQRQEKAKIEALESQLNERDAEIEKLKGNLHRVRQIMLESTALGEESMACISILEDPIPTDGKLDTIFEEPTIASSSDDRTYVSANGSQSSSDTSASTHNNTVKFISELQESAIMDTSETSMITDKNLPASVDRVFDKRLTALKSDLSDTEKKCDRMQGMVSSFKNEVDEESEKLKSQIKELDQELKSQREGLEKELESKDRQIFELRRSESRAKLLQETQQGIIEKLKSSTGVATDSATRFYENQVEKMRVRVEELLEEAIRAKENLRLEESKFEAKEKEASRLSLDLRVARRETKNAEEEAKSLRDQLRALRTSHREELSEMKALKTQITSWTAELIAVKSSISKLEMEKKSLLEVHQANFEKDTFLQERDSRISALEKMLQEGQHVQNDWTESVNTLKQELSAKESKIISLTKKCTRLMEACKLSDRNLTEIVEECERRQKQIESLEAKCETAQKMEATLKAEILKTKAAINETESNKIFHEKTVNGKVKELDSKLSSIEGENTFLKELLRQAEVRANQAERQLESSTNECRRSSDLLADAERRIQELKGDLKESEHALLLLSDAKTKLSDEKDAFTARISDLTSESETLRIELSETQTNVEQMTKKLEEREKSFRDHSNQLNSTIAQQNKLIEYLQARQEETDGKKDKKHGLGSRMLGHKTKSQESVSAPVTVIPRQYRELTQMVEEEKSRRMAAEQELDSARRDLAVAKGRQVPPAVHGTPVASTPVARRALAQICLPAESTQPTPQRVRHNIPHKFAVITGSLGKKMMCSRCEKSIGFGQHGLKCRACNVVAHAKCGPIMNDETPFCGLTEEMVRTIAQCSKHNSKIEDAVEATATSSSSIEVEKPDDEIREGKIKTLMNRREWVPQWIRVEGNFLTIFGQKPERETDFPADTWELCPSNGSTSLVIDIDADELPSVHPTDLPFVFKLEKYHDNYMWPKKVLYCMAPSFIARNEWVKFLQDAIRRHSGGCDAGGADVSVMSVDARPPRYELLASAPLAAKVVCCAQSGNKVIFGGLKGLYVVEFGQSEFVNFSTGTHGSVHSVDAVEVLDIALVVAGRTRQLFMTRLNSLTNGTPSSEEALIMVPVNELMDVRLVRVREAVKAESTLLCVAQKNHINILQWTASEAGFKLLRRMLTNNSTQCGMFCDSSLIVGNEKFYEIDLANFCVEEFIDASDPSVGSLTHTAQSHLPRPLAVFRVDRDLSVMDTEFLLAYEDRAVFFDKYGRRSRHFDLKWSRFAFCIDYVEPYLFVQSQGAIEVITVTKKLCLRSPASVHRVVDYDHPMVIGSSLEHVFVSVWAKNRNADPAVNMVDLIAITGKDFMEASLDADASKENYNVTVSFSSLGEANVRRRRRSAGGQAFAPAPQQFGVGSNPAQAFNGAQGYDAFPGMNAYRGNGAAAGTLDMNAAVNGGWDNGFRAKSGAPRGFRGGGRGRGSGRGGRGGFAATAPVPKPPPVVHYCEICRISCAGTLTYEEHLKGSKHKKKEAAASAGPAAVVPRGGCALRCELCDVACTGSDAYSAHIRGSKHQRVVKLHEKLGKPIPSHEPTIILNKPSADGSSMETDSGSGYGAGIKIKTLNDFDPSNIQVVETPSGEKVGIPKLPDEQDAEPVGMDYIEDMKGPGDKVIGYKCNLCDCQFNDVNAKDMHLKGRRHRTQFKKKVDPSLQVPPKGAVVRRNVDHSAQMPSWGGPAPFPEWGPGSMEHGPMFQQPGFFAPPGNINFSINDRVCLAKCAELTPGDKEINTILKAVGSVERGLKTVADAVAAEDSKQTRPLDAERTIKSLKRVGDLANGLIMTGATEVDLVLICGEKPTKSLLEKIVQLLSKELKNQHSEASPEVISDANSGFTVVYPGQIRVQVAVTSALMRSDAEASDKVDGTGSAGNVSASATPTDPADVLDREKCLEALAQLRHSKWFQARLAQAQQAEASIRILRYWARKDPIWEPFSPWIIELFVHEALASSTFPMLPGDIFK